MKSSKITKSIMERKFDELDYLIRAVRFNHNISANHFKLKTSKDIELELYNYKITQLTLPHRFGMYKPQLKNFQPKTDIEIEEPSTRPDDGHQQKEGHKTRPIFD